MAILRREVRTQLTTGGLFARVFIVGAVAQLGARQSGTLKVTGSIPVSSTLFQSLSTSNSFI
jgi:hypothetical protein